MSEIKQRVIFQVSFVAIACVVIEIVLRFQGYLPGDLRPNWLWLQPVDSLVVIRDFYTNSDGLLVADKDYWLKEKLAINTSGFRGKEFSEMDSTKKKVLFIGDSFTWGMSASPFFDSSFCDLLSKATDYEIINTGIPAADPPQYELIAQKYIPQLKPDFVFVMFFTGNDLMKEERSIIPGKPFYYWTNAGAILADIDGHHFNSAEEAYHYIINEKYFLKSPAKWYLKVIAQSALLSRLYSFKFRLNEKIEYEKLLKNTSLTKKYLNRIVETCEQNHVAVKFVLIPEMKEADMSKQKLSSRYSDILLDVNLQPYWAIPTTSKKMFKENPDGHLSNAGHRHYFEFLKNQLDSVFAK